MSVTQNWSWIFSMNSSLYNQLRNLMYSKIVPPNTVTTYNGDVITLNFNPVRTTITLLTDQQDTILLSATVNGNIQPENGVQTSFSGTVSAQVDLDKLYIEGDGAQANTSGEPGITWTNYLYLESGVVSELTVDTGDSSTDALLTSFMQSNIDSYVASSPHSLGEMSSANLDPYFVPTYQKFITLTDAGNSSNPRMMQLVMVNSEAPPTADPHEALDSTSTLDFPEGSNAVFAFNDYTVFDFMATNMEANDSMFTDISVSQNPAVLTAKGKKKSYSIKLTSQIANDSVATTLQMTNAMEANIGYGTTLEIVNESDGTQTLLVTNDLTSSKVGLNEDNAVVISLISVYAVLLALSPLHGIIFYSIMMAIEQRIISLINKAAKKLEFEEDVPIQQTNSKVGITFSDITLEDGVIISANITVSNSDSPEVNSPELKMKQTRVELPSPVNEGLKNLPDHLDTLHDSLTPKKNVLHAGRARKKVKKLI